jgi:hypothetical protein
MSLPSRHEAAHRLIRWHFEVEPELREVYLIAEGSEDSADAPIKLLEVNSATLPTGSVEPFAFAPTKDVPYPTLIAEVTPEELQALQTNPDALPAGWSLDGAERIERFEAA